MWIFQQEENDAEISSEGEEDGEKVTKDALPTEEEDEDEDTGPTTVNDHHHIPETLDAMNNPGPSRSSSYFSQKDLREGRRSPATTTGVNHWGPSGLCNEHVTVTTADLESRPPTEWDLNNSGEGGVTTTTTRTSEESGMISPDQLRSILMNQKRKNATTGDSVVPDIDGDVPGHDEERPGTSGCGGMNRN